MICEKEQIKKIVIGEYPFRGKAHICRLLCEYMKIPYENKFFTPQSWEQFVKNKGKEWVYCELPFLIDGDFILTGFNAMVDYLVEKAQRTELFGRTILDCATVDTIRSKIDSLHQSLLNMSCKERRIKCAFSFNTFKENKWSIFESFIQYINNLFQASGWCLGYLSVLDFFLYELISIMEVMYPQKIQKHSKLLAHKSSFRQIPEIAQYEKSPNAVNEINPYKYLQRFMNQKCWKKMQCE